MMSDVGCGIQREEHEEREVEADRFKPFETFADFVLLLYCCASHIRPPPSDIRHSPRSDYADD